MSCSAQFKGYSYFLIVLASILDFVSSDGKLLDSLFTGVTCEQLKPAQNVVLKCTNGDLIFECNGNQEVGTIATYSCKPYYTVSESIDNSVELQCQPDGTWSNKQELDRFTCEEDCGKRSGNLSPFIINGNVTNVTLWPWHATLFTNYETEDWQYICGASIIRSNVILTAAHCISPGGVRPLNESFFQVIVATISSNYTANLIAYNNNNNVRIFKVRRIYITDNFNPRTFQADLALIELDGEIEYNENVSPVCLPTDLKTDFHAVQPGTFGDVVGFGIDETNQLSGVLKHANIEVIENEDCFESFRKTLSESQFCAGNLNRSFVQTVCNGDSGGGLVFPSTAHKKYFIRGIISFGDPPEDKILCKSYAVFTRIINFIIWIHKTLEKITGERIREHAIKYEVIVRGIIQGDQITKATFLGFPTEWKNRIDKVELAFANVHPKLLLDSLKDAKTVRIVNLTNVYLDQDIIEDTRVYLPYLEIFILDYVNKEAEAGQGSLNKKYCQFSEEYLKRLLFFDKEYKYDSTFQQLSTSPRKRKRDWELQHILRLGVQIKLIIGNIRTIIIDHKFKFISFYGVPKISEILSNIPSYLQLRQLRLGQCEISLQQLHQLVNTHGSSLKEIVIVSNNFGNITGTNISLSKDIVRKLVNIQFIFIEWVVYDEPKDFIDLIDISNHSIEKLYFTNCNFRMNSSSFSSSLIQFQKLETFYCDNCKFDKNILTNFEYIFPNLRHLTLLKIRQPLPINNIIKNLPYLFNVYLTLAQDYNNNDNLPVNSTLFGLDLNLDEIEQPYFIPNTAQRFYLTRNLNTNTNSTWSLFPGSEIGEHTICVIGSGLSLFYTSYAEYILGRRQSPNEALAYDKGVLKYNGTKVGSTNTRTYIEPLELNNDILKILTQVEICNAIISPTIFTRLLSNAPILQVLKLDRVEFAGETLIVSRYVHNLKQFVFNRVGVLPELKYAFMTNQTYFRFLIPFEELNSQTDLNSGYLSYPNDIYEKSRIGLIDLSIEGCRIFFIDKRNLEAISIMSRLSFVNITNTTMPVYKLALRAPATISSDEFPSSVVQLNLEDIKFQSNNDISNILRKATKLKQLRFSRNFVQDSNNFRAILPLADSPTTIEHLELRRVNLAVEDLHASSARITFPDYQKRLKIFPNLHTIYCMGDVEFDAEILSNFEHIFPSVRRLAILYVNDIIWYFSQESPRHLLLNILENRIQHNVEIVGVTLMGRLKNGTLGDLFDIVTKAGANPFLTERQALRQHFLLKRGQNGKWEWLDSGKESNSIEEVERKFIKEDAFGEINFGESCKESQNELSD